VPRGRRLKMASDGSSYHVMARTARQEFAFTADAIKEWMYRHMVWLSSIYYVEFHAITIMDNHYHLVLSVRKPPVDERDVRARFETFQKSKRHPTKWGEWLLDEWYAKLTDLSCFMQELNRSMACHVNRLDGKRGHLWGERFKSVLIEDGIGMLQCLAYVELNCVRAGICEKPSDYRFCSVGRFVQGGRKAAGVTFPSLKGFEFLQSAARQQRAFALFVDSLALREAGKEGTYPVAMAEIKELVEKIDIKDFADLALRRTRWAANSLILGSEAFCREMIGRFGLQPLGREHPVPFQLTSVLCNGHMRAGPHAR
jgi:putative transposase